MASAVIVSRTLELLSGELQDSSGTVLTPAAQPVVEVHDSAEARAALAAGRRVAIAVPLSASGAMQRIASLSVARPRIKAARRCLERAGAKRLRAFAVVCSGGDVLLAYELGDQIQPYVEDNLMLQPAPSAPADAVRRGIHWLSGLPAAVDLVAVVGEPA